MNIIRIVAAVVDTRQLTLYKEDGETVTIPQGDPRLRRILEVATPQLESNRQEDGSSWADVNITEVAENSYADFQEQAKGIRFFRVAKAKLKQLLKLEAEPSTEHVHSHTVGKVPAPLTPQQQVQAMADEVDKMIGTPPSPSVTAAPAAPVSVTPAPVAEEDPIPVLNEVVVPTPEVVAGAAQLQAEAEEGETGLDGEQDRRGLDLSDDGKDDQAETFEPVVDQVPEVKVTQTMSVVDEIIAHAVPVTSSQFHEEGIVKQRPIDQGYTVTKAHPDESAKDTIIAVVDGKVIPGMELVKSQFARAAKSGSTQGAERFLQRLATVIETRSHSVEDLLKFMERADLPIADDGSIIIYKVLRRSGDKYKDCHSGKVQQWVGAYVCMDPSLVDHKRNNECSNGLHVARRGYISQFSGDVCVLAKLAPEDVITVPTYDANKMRVCGYHILHELSQTQYDLLKRNRPITEDPEGKTVLARAMCGDHIRKTHEVRITGSMGSGVTVKDIPKDEEPAPILTPDAPKEVEAIADAHEEGDTPVAPAEVATIQQATMTRKEQALALYEAWDGAAVVDKPKHLEALLAFKKAAKVGWDRLGIPDPTETKEPKVVQKPSQPAPKEGEPIAYGKRAMDDRKAQKEPAKQPAKEPVKVAPPPAKKALPAASEGSPRERIAKLKELGLDSKEVAQKIYDIKKASKKSWEILGLTEEESMKVLRVIGKVT